MLTAGGVCCMVQTQAEVEEQQERIKKRRRESAQRSRARKNTYMKTLEVRVSNWLFLVRTAWQAGCPTCSCSDREWRLARRRGGAAMLSRGPALAGWKRVQVARL